MENRLNVEEREVNCSNHGALDFEYIDQHVRTSTVVPSESTSRQELERGLKSKYPEDDVEAALTDYEIQNGELPPSYDIFEDFLKNSKVDLKEENKQLNEQKARLELELKGKDKLIEEMLKLYSGHNQTDIPFALQEPRQNFAQNHKYVFIAFITLIVVVLLIFMYFFYHGCFIPCIFFLK